MTRPSSTNEAVASLSSGLIPRTRMVIFFQLAGYLGDRRGTELGPRGQRLQDLFDAGEQPVLVGRGAGVGPPARGQRGAVDGETDARQLAAAQLPEEGGNAAAQRVLEIEP